ncbi:MAG: T9SS type B sorting domain-containing protein [Bacteroidetes bacterium]|nr:T9SS type B sorting domain-containing protein [Bacteroidota bacterium]
MFSTLSFNGWNVTFRRDINMDRLLAYSWCILSFLGVIQPAKGQNLVLNPSFEDYTTCPTFIDQMNRATHWGKPTPGTPDYFHSCTTFPSISTPSNGFGTEAAFDGNAYAGLVSYVDTNVYGGFANYREYIKGQLSEPLVSGKFYAIRFMLSVGDAYRYATDNLGMYLTDSVEPWTGAPTDYPALGLPPYSLVPQVEYSGLPIDNLSGWTPVYGEFEASGGEQAFILGNFQGDASTTRTDLQPWASAMAYYFIDAVSVERIYIAPLAVPDSGVTTELSAVLVAVLDNDIDMDGILDPGSLTLTSAPTGGSANLEPATGEILYTPMPGFYGLDSFNYRICDEEGLCDTTWVQVRVMEAVDPVGPNLVNDVIETPWTTAVSIAVLTNDASGSSPLVPSTLQLIDAWSAGAVVLDGISGMLLATPAPLTCGESSFRYSVCDQNGLCDTAEVRLKVICSTPACQDDEYNVLVNDSMSLAIFLNDQPGNGHWNPSSFVLRTDPLLGQVARNADGLTYTAGQQTGLDRFRYEHCDEAGLCSQAWITVRVSDVPVLPTVPDLFIPDVITPNGDGFNDEWTITALQAFDQHEIWIINRWEHEVFRTDAYQNDWNGDNLPDGTYFYILRVFDGQQGWTYTGALTLLR